LIGRTLKEIEPATLDTASAQRLLGDACTHAGSHGLAFRPEVLRLQADDRLQELVRRSRDAAAQSEPADEA
jgi:hypothetical protein